MGQLLNIQIIDVPQITEHEVEDICKRAIAERDLFLQEHPNMQPFQDEIDRLMINSGSFQNRMAVLGIMMEANLLELRKNLSYLMILVG